ncbi:MAG: hypothetical protein K0R91_244 [Nitrososphaeraceae archaeon]|nr:hypothetical protein [Nitrososphaeraceae archaeon]
MDGRVAGNSVGIVIRILIRERDLLLPAMLYIGVRKR